MVGLKDRGKSKYGRKRMRQQPSVGYQEADVWCTLLRR